MNIKELKELIKNIPDNTPIVVLNKYGEPNGIESVEENGLVLFKDHKEDEPIFHSEYNMREINREEIKDSVNICTINLFEKNSAWSDIQDSQYNIKNGITNPNL